MKKLITLANFATGTVKNTVTGEVKKVDANLSKEEVMARWMKKRKADEEKYLERFKKKSDKELIYCFNDQVGNGGCVAAKMDYLSAMHSEFINRGWDYSVVGNEGRFSTARRVKLEKNVLKLKPWRKTDIGGTLFQSEDEPEKGGKMKERKEEDLKGLKFGIGKTRPDRTEGKR